MQPVVAAGVDQRPPKRDGGENQVPYASRTSFLVRGAPARYRLSIPSGRINPPWRNTTVEFGGVSAEIKPGVYLRVAIEKQPLLPKIGAGSIAIFLVLEVGGETAKGLDLAVYFVGARSGSLEKALLGGPFDPEAPGEQALMHLVKDDAVLMDNDPYLLEYPRLHVMAVAVLYREEIEDAWCRKGLDGLDAIRAGDSRFPTDLQGPRGVADEADLKARAAAAADRAGRPAKDGAWNLGRLGGSKPDFVTDRATLSDPGKAAQFPEGRTPPEKSSRGDRPSA